MGDEMLHIDPDLYAKMVAALAAWIALGALWIVLMMLGRMAATRMHRGPDVAAVLYVGSTVTVFGVIALRYGAKLAMWIVLVMLLAKALGITGIAAWMYVRMRKERL